MPRKSKRDIVLDAAEELFLQFGPNSTGINAITQKANVASMTLYNNFKDKEALIASLVERTTEYIKSEWQEAMSREEPLVDLFTEVVCNSERNELLTRISLDFPSGGGQIITQALQHYYAWRTHVSEEFLQADGLKIPAIRLFDLALQGCDLRAIREGNGDCYSELVQITYGE